MKFPTIQDYNRYAGIQKTLNNDIQVGEYDIDKVRKVSKDISIDFYRISIKTGFGEQLFKTKKEYPCILYLNSPSYPFNWETSKSWNGFFMQFTKEWRERHGYFNQSFLEYGQHDALFIQEDDLKEIKSIFYHLSKHYKNEKWDTPLFLSYTNILFELVEELYKKQFNVEEESYNRIVNEFYTLLKSYHNEPQTELPSVASFASKMNISSNYLGDIIKHFTKRTATDLIKENLLNHAKKFLLETNMSVSEIAYYLGYDYPTYFSRDFKKHLGNSPKKFRNQ